MLYDSIRGPIETEWRVSSDKRTYSVGIPANVTATLRLEGRRTAELLIDGQPIVEAGLEGIDEVATDGSSVAVISLPSGPYVFTMPR